MAFRSVRRMRCISRLIMPGRSQIGRRRRDQTARLAKELMPRHGTPRRRSRFDLIDRSMQTINLDPRMPMASANRDKASTVGRLFVVFQLADVRPVMRNKRAIATALFCGYFAVTEPVRKDERLRLKCRQAWLAQGERQ